MPGRPVKGRDHNTPDARQLGLVSLAESFRQYFGLSEPGSSCENVMKS